LVEAAAETLIQELSERVARTWQAAKLSPDPVRFFCLSLWRECFMTRQGAMLSELNYASRHSSELALIVSRLWTQAYQALTEIDRGAEQEGPGEAGELPVSIGRMVMMSVWFMRGMAADAHLGAAEGLFEAYLESWIRTIRNPAAGGLTH
jgi:hypothetical protein